MRCARADAVMRAGSRVQPRQVPGVCGNLLHSNDFGGCRPLLSGCWEWQDRLLEGGKLKEELGWALQGDGREGNGSLDEERILIRDGELFG